MVHFDTFPKKRYTVRERNPLTNRSIWSDFCPKPLDLLKIALDSVAVRPKKSIDFSCGPSKHSIRLRFAPKIDRFFVLGGAMVGGEMVIFATQ